MEIQREIRTVFVFKYYKQILVFHAKISGFFFYVSFIELSHTGSFWKILIEFNTCRILCYISAWKLDCFLFSIDKSHKEYGIHILSTASNILTILEALLLSRN